jgi:F-type H+-transporting ATPase subunit a
VNARIALPAFMAIVVWVLYNFIGIKKQGFFGYFKAMLFPPGVPKALYLLVTPIELVSTLFVRPLSLAVRLFANSLAGHLILVSFAVITAALFDATIVGAAAPGALLVALTGFELLVAVLQAYIFTILAAVFIGGAMHPEH